MRSLAYCARARTCFLLPLEMSVGRAAVQLRLAPSRNNQRQGIHWAQRSSSSGLHCEAPRAHSSAGRASGWQRRRSPVRARLGPPEKPPRGGFFRQSPGGRTTTLPSARCTTSGSICSERYDSIACTAWSTSRSRSAVAKLTCKAQRSSVSMTSAVQPVARERFHQVAAEGPPGDVDLDRLAHLLLEYPC